MVWSIALGLIHHGQWGQDEVAVTRADGGGGGRGDGSYGREGYADIPPDFLRP